MSDSKNDLKAEYDLRVQRWGLDYEYDGPSVLAESVVHGGRLLELLSSPEVADEAMKVIWLAMAQKIYNDPASMIRASESWRNLFEDFPIDTAIAEFPLGQTMVALSYYAEEGILSPDGISRNARDAEQLIRDQIEEASTLYYLLPRDFGDATQLERLLAKAEARFALDNGGAVTLPGLALLASVSVKSVRNALAPGSVETLETNSEGLITNVTAQAWLGRRDAFRSSIWRAMAGATIDPLPEPDESVEYVFVPEARDGSFFRPSDRMTKGWKIGTKEGGHFVQNFWDALDQLNRLSTPRWRRPSKTSGTPGVVTGVRFRRLLKKQVEDELNALSN